MTPPAPPPQPADEPTVLNPPVIRLLMTGAGLRTDRDLCAQIGINPSNFSRWMRADEVTGRRQEPSPRAMSALMRRFPLADPAVMFVPESAVHDPAHYAMTRAEAETGFAHTARRRLQAVVDAYRDDPRHDELADRVPIFTPPGGPLFLADLRAILAGGTQGADRPIAAP